MQKIKPQIKRLEKFHQASGETERVITEFMWTSGYGSWRGRSFRVIAKVEYKAEAENPLNVRFIVTSLDPKYSGRVKSISVSIVVAVSSNVTSKKINSTCSENG